MTSNFEFSQLLRKQVTVRDRPQHEHWHINKRIVQQFALQLGCDVIDGALYLSALDTGTYMHDPIRNLQPRSIRELLDSNRYPIVDVSHKDSPTVRGGWRNGIDQDRFNKHANLCQDRDVPGALIFFCDRSSKAQTRRSLPQTAIEPIVKLQSVAFCSRPEYRSTTSPPGIAAYVRKHAPKYLWKMSYFFAPTFPPTHQLTRPLSERFINDNERAVPGFTVPKFNVNEIADDFLWRIEELDDIVKYLLIGFELFASGYEP